MIILAIDPGGTLGYVRAEPCQPPKLAEILGWGETKHHQLFLEHVELGCSLGIYDQLVVERWSPVGGRPKTFEPDAQEQIGALKYIAWKYDVPLALQTVSSAREFATPTKLALFKDDRVGKGSEGDHAQMALKHLIRFRWIQFFQEVDRVER